MSYAAGDLDRVIYIEEATVTTDAAGDETTTWGPPTTPREWPRRGRRWASRKDQPPRETPGDLTNQVTSRSFDTVWRLRQDQFSLAIAPETFRVVYKGRVFEIVGLVEDEGRGEGLRLLCSSRPDMRGSRAPESRSG